MLGQYNYSGLYDIQKSFLIILSIYLNNYQSSIIIIIVIVIIISTWRRPVLDVAQSKTCVFSTWVSELCFSSFWVKLCFF